MQQHLLKTSRLNKKESLEENGSNSICVRGMTFSYKRYNHPKLDHLQKDVDDTAVADEAHEEEDYEDDGGDVTDHRMLDHGHNVVDQ